jgi:hypothetical protein
MARGDGKALKGRTKGNPVGVKRMALGGFMGGKPSGGNQSPSGSMGGFGGQASRAEASRSTGSAGGYGGQTSRAEAGGNNDRVGVGGVNTTTTIAERASAMTSPAAQNARLGPNAAQAMVDAGVSPDTALRSAMSINERASYSPSILGDRNPGQRLATANRDGSFSYSPVQSSTIAKRAKEFYDQILPNEPNRTMFPSAAPVGTLGSFGSAATRSIAPAAPPAPTYGTPKFRSSYEDQQSIVPGSVTFSREKQFTPFAQTKAGMSLLEKSKSPLTREQATALQKQFPEGSSMALAGGKPPPGTTAYPATVGGFKVDVFVPDKAGTTTLGPKLGQFNPAPTPQKAQPQTGSVGTQTPRAEAAFTPKPTTKPAPVSTKKATQKEGSVFVKDGVRYQIRDGKAYNFNVPGGSKRGNLRRDDRFGGEDRERGGNKRDGGVISKADGAATRGKTRGRYL